MLRLGLSIRLGIR